MNRENIFEIINEERNYQDDKWGDINVHPHEVGAWILIMESLLSDARKAWQSKSGDIDALIEIRKVVATGIACMEQHGVLSRKEVAKINSKKKLMRKLDQDFRRL